MARRKGFEPLTFWSVASVRESVARFPALFHPLLSVHSAIFQGNFLPASIPKYPIVGQVVGHNETVIVRNTPFHVNTP